MMDTLDLFNDSITIFGDQPVPKDDRITYGKIVLSVAPKVSIIKSFIAQLSDELL
jgi:hypothetical protein